MLWLVWHMWILLLLAFAGGLIAGWILRSRSDEAPQRAALAAPPAKPGADPEPAADAPPAPHVPAPGPGADDPSRPGPSASEGPDSKVAAAFTAPDVSAPAPAETSSGAEPAKTKAASSRAGASETASPSTPAAKTSKTAKTDDGAGGDDLTAIKGLGPRAAEKLAEAGVTRLSQIAAWSAADIEKYDELVNARGRIARDDWVGQAKALNTT